MNLILWIVIVFVVVFVLLSGFEAFSAWQRNKRPPALSQVLQADDSVADAVVDGAVADVKAELAKLPAAPALPNYPTDAG